MYTGQHKGWIQIWHSATLVVIVAVLVAPRAADGEEATPFTEARERFRRGTELYEGGLYEAALSEFQRAYELSPAYEVLFNIGQVHAQLAHFPEAVTTFEQYLSEGGGRVPAAARAEVERELERLRHIVGRIRVDVTNPEGAVIYLDRTEVGHAPLDAPLAVNSGQHVIEVRAEGFLPFSRDISVAGGTIIDVRVTLVEPPETPDAPGTLVIASNAIGATITLDGEEVGVTPLADGVAVSPGPHVVELSRTGYRTQRVTVSIHAGEVEHLDVSLRSLEQISPSIGGIIEVTASEDDVVVHLDGETFEPGIVPAGPHRVEVIRPGFRRWAREVNVSPGSTVRVEAQLVPTQAYRSAYEARARSYRVIAWVLLGVSLGAAAGGIGLFVWNYQNEDDRVQEMRDINARIISGELAPGEEADLQARWEQLNSDDNLYTIFNGVSAGIWALSGILAVVGGVLLGVGPNPGRYRDVSVVPSLGGLALSVTWGGSRGTSNEVHQ